MYSLCTYSRVVTQRAPHRSHGPLRLRRRGPGSRHLQPRRPALRAERARAAARRMHLSRIQIHMQAAVRHSPLSRNALAERYLASGRLRPSERRLCLVPVLHRHGMLRVYATSGLRASNSSLGRRTRYGSSGRQLEFELISETWMMAAARAQGLQTYALTYWTHECQRRSGFPAELAVILLPVAHSPETDASSVERGKYVFTCSTLNTHHH